MSHPSTNSAIRRDMAVIASYPTLLQQEEQMVKHPYDVNGWFLYLAGIDDLLDTLSSQKKKSILVGGRTILPSQVSEVSKELQRIRRRVGQRAVTLLPGSYKLWKYHLEFMVSSGANSQKTCQAFEHALMRLHKMPRIWLLYLEYFEQHSQDITQIRRLYNRALESLPVTQHAHIWKPFLSWLSSANIPAETTLRVMRRHVQLDPSQRLELATKCLEFQRYGEAALLYLELLNDPTTTTSKQDLWMSLADTCTHHPQEVQRAGIDFDALVRAALPSSRKNEAWNVIEEQVDDDSEEHSQEHSQQMQQLGELAGTLWAKLADYYIRLGEFEMARSIYQEALESVDKVRDFSILFDAYLKLEEGIVEANMMEMNEEEEEAPEAADDDLDILLLETSSSTMADMELALSRAEHLTARRPLLLNRVLLKQNPHNVGEWLRRSQLYVEAGETKMAQQALRESLQTVNARKAVNGMPSSLVLELAKLLPTEEAKDLFDGICNQSKYLFKQVDDLAKCHAASIELELAQEQWDDALALARKSVAPPDASLEGAALRVAKGLPKSLLLWNLLLDLEESLGTVATTKDSYNRAMELKVATPMHVLNFCTFLWDRKYFEEAFTAYERGIELFGFPQVLWKSYLEKFLERYGGSKMERTRDLFDRCIDACPPEDASDFFLEYAKFEEQHGLVQRALKVYGKMCHKVPAEEKYTAYQLWIQKTSQFLGLSACRDVYQEAIEKLADRPAAQICLEFAKMETSLQEVDRARAVLAYGAQLADPRRFPEYYKEWHEFEVSHGNEETFREMLRVKRSVQAAFSSVNYNAVDVSATETATLTDQEAMHMIADREGVELAQEKTTATSAPVKGFVPSKRTAEAAQLEDVENRVAKLRKATAQQEEARQDEEIDIDDLDEDEDDDEKESKQKAVQNVSTKAVPSAVFGGLAPAESEEKMGALERLRAAKGESQQE